MRYPVFVALAALTQAAVPREIPSEGPPFVEVTADAGLHFVHDNGATGELLLPEVIGSGGAVFDYDNDGDMDVFVVQAGTMTAGPGRPSSGSRLYRNDSAAGLTRRLHFIDVTATSGLSVNGYGMGAATGDVDNDGWVDLYVTGLTGNRLFKNDRDGTFTDVTAASGTGDGRWSTSATFFDYDRDGWLDLYVVHYVDFSVGMKRRCFAANSARDYCNPAVYGALSDSLFHNNGDGTFSDVSARAGIAAAPARGLGVIAADFNGDGWVDIYVANDGDSNQLWINRGGTGAFADGALIAGVALSRSGRPQGSMGVDLGDVDGDDDHDLFVTNLDNEGNTMYRSLGGGLFEDRSVESGVFKLGFTGFGTRFIDYDNDGWLDLVVVNGAVRRVIGQPVQGDAFPLRQRNQLFRNDRGRRFTDVTDRAGAAFAGLFVGRGAAAADLDNDGDTDLVLFNNDGPTRVLLNVVGQRQHWLGIRAVERGRDAVQTQVAVTDAGGRHLTRRVQTDGSYCSANDPRVVFGLGASSASRTVRVSWPGGPVEEFPNLAVDRYWILEAGKPPRMQP